MHFRNSCTRSTSACAIRHVPSGASGGRGLKRLMLFFTSKFHETSVTRSLISGNARIGSTVTGSVEIELVQPGHAHQPRIAVDLGRARPALAGLAVPANGEIVRLLGLNLVDGVEHDHAFGDRGRVVL